MCPKLKICISFHLNNKNIYEENIKKFEKIQFKANVSSVDFFKIFTCKTNVCDLKICNSFGQIYCKANVEFLKIFTCKKFYTLVI